MQEISLRNLIDQEGPLSPERALDIGARIARAVDNIHDRGEVHGSIRPEYVLIRGDRTVKIEELGESEIAVSTTSSELEPVTKNAASYMSPEAVQGSEIDRRADLYSLGVVLFEMLTGDLPFRGLSPASLAYQQAKEPPPRLDVVDPEMSPHVAECVDKALAKDPSDRHQSAYEMAGDLERALGRLALPAPVLPDSEPEPRQTQEVLSSPKWHRVAMASAVLVLAAAGVLPMLPTSDVRSDPFVDQGSDGVEEVLGESFSNAGTWPEPFHVESDFFQPPARRSMLADATSTTASPGDRGQSTTVPAFPPTSGPPASTSPVPSPVTTSTAPAPTTTASPAPTSTASPTTTTVPATTTTTPLTTTTVPASTTTTTVPASTTTTAISTTTTTEPVP
jgi:serine/threonine protein kinase